MFQCFKVSEFQSFKVSKSQSFSVIFDSTEWWFNQDTSRISNSVFGYKSFARWKTFLSSRVDESGTLRTYAIEYAKAVEEIRNRSLTSIGNEWESLGPIENSYHVSPETAYLGIVTGMKVIDEDTIYAGGGTGGLFRTFDGGQHWECITEGYGVPGVEAIEVNPQNHAQIYIGTGFFTWGREYSFGVMKSLDHGLTWTKTLLDEMAFDGANYVISDMCMDPDNPLTLIAIANCENTHQDGTHLMMTTDGGESSWVDILPPAYFQEEFKKIEIDPSGFGKFYLSGTKVLRFELAQNGTYTWTDLTPNLMLGNALLIRATTAINSFDPNKMLVVLEKKLSNGSNMIDYYYSYNSGSTFILLTTIVSDPRTPNYFKMEVEWSKKFPTHFYVGGTTLGHYSITANNQMVVYDVNNSSYHYDIRHLELIERKNVENNSESEFFIFTGNDGGVSKAMEVEEELNFIDITNYGMNITQYYGIGIPTDGSHTIIGGTQDGNFDRYNNGEWYKNVRLSDNGEVVFDYNNPNIAYIVQFCLNDCYLKKTTDKGVNWTNPFNWGTSAKRNDAPIEMSNLNSQVLLIGGKQVLKSTNGGNSFTQLSNENTNYITLLKAIRFAPSNNDVIYAAYDGPIGQSTTQKRLIKSNNGGISWVDITPRENLINLKEAGIFDLAVDPYNQDIFYITLDRNKDGHKVYKGEGTTTIIWTNISEGLLNLPVNCIEIWRGSTTNEMFVGTDDGIYYRNNLTNRWIPFGTGFPIVSVSDLEIDYVNNLLIASTFGRGVYRLIYAGLTQ